MIPKDLVLVLHLFIPREVKAHKDLYANVCNSCNSQNTETTNSPSEMRG